MDAYVFQAALLCGSCGTKTKDSFSPELQLQIDTTNSDTFPQGPFTNVGGEADTPQHCDHCGVFLENPLTRDGINYVRAALRDHADAGRGAADVLQVWATFYEEQFVDQIDEFTRGYVTCALWLCDESPGSGEWSKFDEFFADLSTAALKSMQDDCVTFQGLNAETLALAYEHDAYTAARAGHDFWLTRNRHGSGFWDGDLGEAGDALTTAAHSYGERSLYRGDDKLIYEGEG